MADNNRAPLIEVKDLKEYFNINVGLFKSKPLKAAKFTTTASSSRQNPT